MATGAPRALPVAGPSLARQDRVPGRSCHLCVRGGVGAARGRRQGPRSGEMEAAKGPGAPSYPLPPPRRERHLSPESSLHLYSSLTRGLRRGPPAPVPASVLSGPTGRRVSRGGQARSPRGGAERGVSAGGRQRRGTPSEGKTKRRKGVGGGAGAPEAWCPAGTGVS